MNEVAHLTKLRGEDDEYEYFDTSIGYPARIKIGEASVGDAVMHVGGEDWVKIETRPNEIVYLSESDFLVPKDVAYLVCSCHQYHYRHRPLITCETCQCKMCEETYE